jgi:hypothetical protein
VLALADPLFDGLMGGGTKYKGVSLRGDLGADGFAGEIGANWK